MATAKKNPFNFKYTPAHVRDALLVLQGYINERAAVVDAGQLPDTATGVKLMAAIQDFAAIVGKMAKSPAELLYNSMRFTTLPSLMDTEDIVNVSVDGVGRCNLHDDITCEVKDKVELHKWLTDNKLEDLITEVVNAQTLAAQMRARIKENAQIAQDALRAGTTDPATMKKLLKPMPPDSAVKITPVVRAQLTREKAKAGE